MNHQLVWKDEFKIGVAIIDQEHERLFKIIRKLVAFGKEKKKSQWACQEGIKYFKEHALRHFADEETYMTSIHYEGLETHRYLHQDFQKNILPALERELELTHYSSDAVSHFLGVCAGWLIGHTLTEDQAITKSVLSKWRNLLPEEEHEIMKKAIIQLIYDMFQLKSHVISESYSGEKFGSGIYYRLVYSTKQDETWEILLVFEEKLLFNTVGKILQFPSDKLDTILINATRYTARQFVERIRKQLPHSELYEMKEENLLTYEQFQEIFQQEKPQFSLLFDTGSGYFSYCVIAPHLLKNGIGTPIHADNAITEIENYLRKRELTPKQKILVVDDSSTARQNIKELLEKDYEVTLAKSGVSAIRCITLNRPDLILLDYEMPICDGKQVLEMIRSEEDFANLSVIFLTGKTNPEYIKKVLSLKPEGYLSKYLDPADIKKTIDHYFATKI